MASANIKHVSDSNFEGEVLKSPHPGTHRLLGAVVRTMQKYRAGAR